MTTSNPLLVFGIFALFAAGFCFYFYLILKRVTRKTRTVAVTPEMKAMLNTEVSLTPEEQKSMRRRLVTAGLLIGVILFGLITVTGLNYWRFAITGEEVTASITNKSSHRSSGRRNRTTYTYTLQATVNGIVVKDSYRAGSSSGYDVGDTVSAYATNEAPPQLAIAAIEDRDPFLEVLYFAGLGGFFFVGWRQWRSIRSGKMKLGNIPVKFRKERLWAMQSVSSMSGVTSDVTATSMPKSTTSSGLPAYTIGPGNEGNDGSNYKV